MAAGVARRIRLEDHKKALLGTEQERERRHMEEVLRRLEAIEKQRLRARERKLDRGRRRIAFAKLLEHSALMLQRVERGRQARTVGRIRAQAVAKISKWLMAMIRRALLVKATKNRAILQMMVAVETMVEKQIGEACFFIKSIISLRHFGQHRSARTIQRRIRKRVAFLQCSATVISRAVRCWLARCALRRLRIRQNIRRHHGSLSRRALGLPDIDPLSNIVPAAMLIRDGSLMREYHWWDSGAPIVPRPRPGNPRAESEKARSRQQACTLADLIRSGNKDFLEDMRGVAKEGRVGAKTCDGSGKKRGTKSAGSKKRRPSERAVSMIDPREAEAAALKDDAARRQARKEAGVVACEFKNLSIIQKHLLRQIDFHKQREKRRIAGEKEVLRKTKQRAGEAAEEFRRKVLETEMRRKNEEQRAQRHLIKIHKYREKKAAKELVERKLLVAKREEERRAEKFAEVKRAVADTEFAKEKTVRLERARKKRRTEGQAKMKEAVAIKIRKEAKAARGTKTKPTLAATFPARRFKKTNVEGRTALAPITGNNREIRKRRRVPMHGDGGSVVSGVRRSRVIAGVRDGRLKMPHNTRIPALPVVPGWKAMAEGTDRGNRKRTRRRPPKEGGGRDGGERRAVSDFDGFLKSKSADVLGLLDEDTVPIVGAESIPLDSRAYRGGLPDESSEQKGTSREYRECPADGESLALETLDSFFPAPGPLANSGGGEGLGPTSAPEGLSPGWSSASSKISKGRESSSGSLSSTAAIRKGKADLVNSVVAASGRNGAAGGVNVAELVGGSLRDQFGMFPDNISDLSDSVTFGGKGYVSFDSTSSLNQETLSNLKT